MVGGTNGKGSTATFLFELLKAHGLRPGLYLSPHVERVTERIRLPEGEIAEEWLENLWSQGCRCIEEGLQRSTIKVPPSYFELMTACALKAFESAKIDIAILEVGLGGRWDATNIVQPFASIITALGKDHEEYLGHRMADIAAEKFGIARPEKPLLCGVHQKHLKRLLRRWAYDIGAVWMDIDRHPVVKKIRMSNNMTWFACDAAEHRVPPVMPGIPGGVQLRNAALAEMAAAIWLESVGIPWNPQAAAEAFSRTSLPGRLERLKMPGGKVILLDGAHNPPAMRNLVHFMIEQRNIPFDVIFGCLRDKPWRTLLRIIRPQCDVLYLVEVPNTSRTWNRRTLVSAAHRFHGFTFPELSTALDQAMTPSRLHRTLCITGSFYLVGAARTFLIQQGARPIQKRTPHN